MIGGVGESWVQAGRFDALLKQVRLLHGTGEPWFKTILSTCTVQVIVTRASHL